VVNVGEARSAADAVYSTGAVGGTATVAVADDAGEEQSASTRAATTSAEKVRRR
jgi:hypothetical protein